MIYILFCLLAVVVLGVCIIIILWHHMRLKKEMAMLEESFMDLRQLNFELRSVRHDYLNHLQVVYGLLELEEYDELKSYLKPVYKEMMKTGKALKTSKPALNALLMAKMKEAETQGIATQGIGTLQTILTAALILKNQIYFYLTKYQIGIEESH